MSSGGFSGAAQIQIVRALAQGLDPEAFETEAWMLNEGGMLVPGLTAAGAHAEVVRFAGVRDPVGALRVGRALIRRRPAIIHLHIGGRARIALARRLTSARLVAHLWGAYADDGLTALPLDQLARRADVTIATSRAVGAAIDVPATVVYPGVDAAEHPAAPPRPQVVGTAARLEPVKRIDDLLAAVSMLRDRHPDIRVEIAGEGSCADSLRETTGRLGLGEVVTFLGWRDDLPTLLRRWSVFVVPSAHEGFGIAPLEAMAAGTPIVASAADGLSELVVDRVTGFIVEPGDIATLADRIDGLLKDEERRSRMAAAALERARARFGTGRMVSEIAGIYEDLLAGRIEASTRG